MSDGRFRILLGLGVVLLVIAAGSPAMRNGFLNFDDPGIILENPRVREPSVANAVAVFSERHEHAWLPLYVSSLVIDASFFGLDPAGFHLSSLVWHGLCAVLVGWLVHALFRSRWIAAMAACVFAVHPVAAESVAWAAGRKDQVSLLLLLLSLAFALGHLRRGGLGRVAGAAAFLGLALLAKGTVVVVPGLVVLLWLWCRTDGSLSPRARPGALVGVLTVVALALTAIHYRVALEEGTAGDAGRFTTAEHAINFLQALGRYVEHLVLPVQLSLHYDLEPWPFRTEHAIGALLLVATSAGIVVMIRRRSGVAGIASFAVAFVLVSLAPFNGVFPRSSLAMADRYLIVGLPMVGVFLGAIVGRIPGVARYVAAAVILVCLTLGARSRYAEFQDGETVFRRAMAVEANDPLPMLKVGEALRVAPTTAARKREAVDLFRRAVTRSPDPVREVRARLLLADALLEMRRFKEAIAEYDRLVSLHARHGALLERFGLDVANVRFNQIAAVLGDDQFAAARELLRALLADHPDHVRALMLEAGLDVRRAFETLVDARSRDLIDRARKVVDDSVTSYERVIELSTDARYRRTSDARTRRAAEDAEIQARCDLSRILRQASWRGDHLNEAMRQADFVVRTWPERAEGYLIRAQIVADVDPKQAGTDLALAVERDPNSNAAKRTFSEWLLKMGRNREAVKVLEAAYMADAEDPATLRALRDVYVAAGRSHLDPTSPKQKRDVPKARQAFELARKYMPEDAESWTLSGDCYEAENDLERAAACFERAAGIDRSNTAAARGLARYHQSRGLAILAGMREIAATQPAERREAARQEAQERVAAEFRFAINLAPDSDDLGLARSWLRDRDRSKSVDPVLDRAEAALGRKAFDEAAAILEGAVKMDDAYWRTFELLGHLAMQRGNEDAAETAFKRTLALDADNLPGNDALARIAYRRGHYDKARSYGRRFLDVAGKLPAGSGSIEAEITVIKQLLAAADAVAPESRR